MILLKSGLLYIAAIFSYVKASKLSCGQACQEALSTLAFAGSSVEADWYTTQCSVTLRVESIFICMRTYCTSKELIAGLKDYNNTCIGEAGISVLPYDVINNITDQQIQDLRTVDVVDWSSVDEVDTLVLPSKLLYDISLKTVDAWNSSVTTRADYGYALFGFWAIVLTVGFITRASAFLQSMLQKRNTNPSHQKDYNVADRGKSWMKGWLTTPALLSRRCAEPVGWCTVPPRLQSLTIIAYVIINFVLCCTSYHLFDGNLYWPSKRTQLSRYVADRAGVLAIANFPMLWAFAMRNNVLLWLTGWSFATFNQFHRWAARVATVEAVIHSIAYTVEAFQEGGKAEYVAEWLERYWWCGAIAVISMSLMCVFSLLPIRRSLYEVFLIVHIALAVLLMASLWYHVEIFEGEYNGYIWPCVAVWAFDRVVRLGRLCYLNSACRKTVVSYNADSQIVRVKYANSLVTPKPGTYYYMYVLNGWKLWESHPFTLSSWSPQESSNSSIENTESNKDAEQILSFILRPHDSFTARIRDTIMTKENNENGTSVTSSNLRIAIEGPYGHDLDLKPYSSVLFVIGGTGISVALSHICSFHDAFRKGTVIPLHTVRLVWAVQDISFYEDVFSHELESWLASQQFQDHLSLEIDVYVTGKSSKLSRPTNNLLAKENVAVTWNPKSETGATRYEDSTLSSISGATINFIDRRPCVHDIVTEAVEKNSTRSGSQRLAVVSCGPPSMADDTRAAVVEVLCKGAQNVDYYPESFTW